MAKKSVAQEVRDGLTRAALAKRSQDRLEAIRSGNAPGRIAAKDRRPGPKPVQAKDTKVGKKAIAKGKDPLKAHENKLAQQDGRKKPHKSGVAAAARKKILDRNAGAGKSGTVQKTKTAAQKKRDAQPGAGVFKRKRPSIAAQKARKAAVLSRRKKRKTSALT